MSAVTDVVDWSTSVGCCGGKLLAGKITAIFALILRDKWVQTVPTRTTTEQRHVHVRRWIAYNLAPDKPLKDEDFSQA